MGYRLPAACTHQVVGQLSPTQAHTAQHPEQRGQCLDFLLLHPEQVLARFT